MEDTKPKLINQHNKKTGVTYVYENQPYWCKVNKQPRSKRRCIGHLCKETGTVVPNQLKGRHKRVSKVLDTPVSPTPIAKRSFYGATYLFDQISEQLGLTDDLHACFPDTYKQILSIAYYLILEDNNPLSRFEKWSSLHKHPFGKDIPSQRSSELFASITEDTKTKFFKLQGKRRAEKEFWNYDITSFSSFSETLRQVQYGHNKENDRLPQINLAMIFGEESGLPFYYRKLAGNIPDSKTIKRLLADLSILGFDKVKLLMDRAFHTEENINDLYKNRVKFLIGAKKTISIIKDAIDEAREELHSFENYNEDYGYYGFTVSTHWNYTQIRPNKGDTLKEKKRFYIHVYYNIYKAAEEEREFDSMLAKLYKELQTGKRIDKNEK